MLGYVVINKNLLSEEDFDVYRGYYCGVCKSIGRRYGQIPRLVLSYDIVFLAMVLSSMSESEIDLIREHCIIHPVSKNPVIKNDEALDYAGDMLILLAYYNFLDDKEDEHKVRGTLGSGALKGSVKKLKKKYPEIAQSIDENLSKLSKLEKEKSDSIDLTCEAFGNVLKDVFAGYPSIQSESEKRILENLGYNLGRWIYIMDALDDYEDDKKSGSYNPLIYRAQGLDGLEDVIYNYLGHVSSSLDLLDIKKNKGIIDNIVMLGLRGRTDGLLKKGEE